MRVILRSLSGIAALSFHFAPVLAQTVPIFTPRLPALRPTPQTATIALVGKLPKGTENSAITFEVDAARSVGKPAVSLWRGISLTDAPAASVLGATEGKLLTASDANFVRVQAEGTDAKSLLASVQMLLPRLKQAGFSVILTFEAPAEKPSGWREEITQAVHTLTAAKFGVVRWELKGNAESLRRNYPEWARIVRRAAPSAPIGIFSDAALTGTAGQIAFLQDLVRQKIGLNSIAWRVASQTTFARQIAATRQTLARFPALKSATLWADFAELTPQAAESAWSVMQPLASASLPNAAAGMTCALPTIFRAEGVLTPAGVGLVLHQRMSGTLLPVSANATHALLSASQQGKGFSLLVLGSGDKGGSPVPVTIRLKNLPDAPPTAWRVTRYDALSTWAAPTVPKGNTVASLRPSGIADSGGAGGELVVSLAAGADTPILLECKPLPAPPTKVEFTGDRWFCRAGETFTADAYLTNLTAKPWSGKAELSGTLAGLVTSGLKSTSTGKLEQGKLRLLRYQIRIPAVVQETRACLNLAVNGVRASQEIVILPPLTVALLTPRVDLDAPGANAEFQMQLVNRAASDLTLTLRAGESLFPVIVDKGKTTTQTLSLSIPERDAGVYPVNVAVNLGQDKLKTVQAWIGVPYWCRYAVLKPNIDGDLAEWTDAAPMGMGRQEQIRNKTWRGATDLSAYAYAKWDESFFYLACAVTDDITVAPALNSLATTGDSLLFALTPDPLVVNADKGYGANDMEFCFALTGDGQTHLLRTHGTDAHPAGRLERAVTVIRRVGSRTFYEAAIPWAELGLTAPEAGRKFGFAVAVNDADEGERGAIVWNDGLLGSKRPYLFPPLRLVK